jgi:DNA polymerase III alpha subunit
MAKITSVEYIGERECYDLEVDHPDHQFYLSSGILTSNSHSIAYSINGYHTAYYKKYFPAAFMAAVLRSEVESNGAARDSNIRIYKKEAKRLGLSIVSPDLNKSGDSYDVADAKTIVMGFKAVKGLGDSAVGSIMAARNRHPFKSFADFLYRTESSKVKKDSIQALAKAGAFDSLGMTRRAAFTYYQDIRQRVNKYGDAKSEKGISEQYCTDGFEFDREDLRDEWPRKELLDYENEVMGEYISGTIHEVFDGFFTTGQVFSSVKNMPDKHQVRIEAVIADVNELKFKSGKNKNRTYARCTLTDKNGDSLSMTVWNESYLRNKSKLIPGKPLRAICSVNEWNGTKGLILVDIQN